MIQRIQSIYFLISAAVFGLLFIPSMSFFKDMNNSDTQIAFFQDQMYNISDSNLLFGGTILLVALSLIVLFLFKNRTLQKNVSLLTAILSIAFAILAVVLVVNAGYQIDFSEIRPGMIIPLVAFALLLLGRSSVVKDDKLVKSMDRLR